MLLLSIFNQTLSLITLKRYHGALIVIFLKYLAEVTVYTFTNIWYFKLVAFLFKSLAFTGVVRFGIVVNRWCLFLLGMVVLVISCAIVIFFFLCYRCIYIERLSTCTIYCTINIYIILSSCILNVRSYCWLILLSKLCILQRIYLIYPPKSNLTSVGALTTRESALKSHLSTEYIFTRRRKLFSSDDPIFY